MRKNKRMKKIYIAAVVILFSFCILLTGKSNALSFEKNHDYKQIAAFVKGAAKQFPHILRLHTIGKSYLGKDIYAVEISNRNNKNPRHKPAIYIDGGTHGDEIFGIEVCLYAIDYLLNHYGKDKKVTALLDTRTVYIVPVVNPDAADRYVTTAFGNTRHNLHPFDDDRDGKIDEDPPEDLDGDGFITQMRQKNDEEGAWIELPENPGRMFYANPGGGEKGVYKMWWEEGIDNDGDGHINEDGAGGINLNFNYPANWQPGKDKFSSGAYPLSEPESRAVADFCFAHLNIAIALSNHTSGGFLIQPLLGEKDSAIPGGDKAVFKGMAEVYEKVTGDKISQIGKSPPYLPGTFADWAYKHLGAYSGILELRCIPDKYNTKRQKKEAKETKDKFLKKRAAPAPYEGTGNPVPDRIDGKVSSLSKDSQAISKKREWLKGRYRFLEEELKGDAFVEWKPFNHPTLGKIEIGGNKKIAYEPPPVLLAEHLEQYTRAYIALGELTPLVKIKDVTIKPVQVGEKADGRLAVLEIEVKVRNEGPTRSITKLMENTSLPSRPKVSDLIILEPGKNVKILSGKARARIGSLEAAGKKGHTKSASWLVSLTGSRGQVKIISLSQKGGRDERTITLK